MTVEARTTLLDALRDKLGLTGTKKACDRTDHIGRRHDRRGQSGLAQRGHGGRCKAIHRGGSVRRGELRADERQSVSVRLLSQHRRCRRRCGEEEEAAT